MPDFPRETVEILPLDVAVDGVAVTDYLAQLTLYPSRPDADDWAAPIEIEDELGVMITGLTHGIWSVWVKVTASPETPVIHLGTISIT